MEPLPGFFARRKRDLPPSRDASSGFRACAACRTSADGGSQATSAMSAGRVHQVLATLGYGDAIGHEVLGIQRVLQGAGYESEIFVETADRAARGSDAPTIARWSAPSRPTTCCIHHFSIGSRASRTAYALPGRMALVYHNITPPGVLPRRPQGPREALFPRPPRADGRTSRAASWRSATPSTTGRSSRRSGFRIDRRPARSCPDFTHLDLRARPDDGRAVRRRLDATSCSSGA